MGKESVRGELMRLAYADPPYLGCANRYPEKQEVDHAELIDRLMSYDGWALSTHSPGLPVILRLPNCPSNIHIGAWVKPFASFKPGVNPAYAWEPVIFWGGRKLGRDVATVRDWISSNITLERGVIGAKPEAFCNWVFSMLGASKDDTLDDLYPGSGAVSRAWEKWLYRFELKVTP